jgi:hypothetical protein
MTGEGYADHAAATWPVRRLKGGQGGAGDSQSRILLPTVKISTMLSTEAVDNIARRATFRQAAAVVWHAVCDAHLRSKTRWPRGKGAVHTPVCSPQSNVMADNIVNTFKRNMSVRWIAVRPRPFWPNCQTFFAFQ